MLSKHWCRLTALGEMKEEERAGVEEVQREQKVLSAGSHRECHEKHFTRKHKKEKAG